MASADPCEWRRIWKLTPGEIRARAHASASGRCWWDAPQGLPSVRRKRAASCARPALVPAELVSIDSFAVGSRTLSSLTARLQNL
jgi:hypothetical protein